MYLLGSEAQLPAVKRYMAQGKLPVRARPQDEAEGEEVGTLTFVDNTVDATTGTIRLKGTFSNLDHNFGRAVRARYLRLTTQANAVGCRMRPSKPDRNGQFIYVGRRTTRGSTAGNHGRSRGAGNGGRRKDSSRVRPW